LRVRVPAAIAFVLALAAVAFWGLTRPDPLPAAAIPTHEVDLRNGETLYHAGSCLPCHKAPAGAPGSDRGLPAGGTPFKTPFGAFYPQNLTPDASGASSISSTRCGSGSRREGRTTSPPSRTRPTAR
jgi:hypothetical protein